MRAASKRQMIFKIGLNRSSMRTFLVLPLVEVQNDDPQMDLDHARLRSLRVDLNRIDGERVAKGFQPMKERHHRWHGSDALQLHGGQFLGGGASSRFADGSYLDATTGCGLLDGRAGFGDQGG